jgi:hypothetical protein
METNVSRETILFGNHISPPFFPCRKKQCESSVFVKQAIVCFSEKTVAIFTVSGYNGFC